MPKIYVSTFPFCIKSSLPLEMMKEAGLDVVVNSIGRKHTEEEMADLLQSYDGVIAGTESLSKYVLEKAEKLRFISRVGVGLDSVDLAACKERGISVAYTPDAPAPAVAELTLGLMLNLMRRIHQSNREMHEEKKWTRFFGRRISEVTIGVIGAGRIGGRVVRRLSAFGTPRLLINDISPSVDLDRNHKIEWVDKVKLLKESDVVSIHVPLTPQTKNMISANEFSLMKPDAILINAARGGIVNELDLYNHLKQNPEFQAAVDVFECEPYAGPLVELNNCLLTAHMGSMSEDCRTRMEIDACRELVNFFTGKEVQKLVPDYEYKVQALW